MTPRVLAFCLQPEIVVRGGSRALCGEVIELDRADFERLAEAGDVARADAHCKPDVVAESVPEGRDG